MKQRTFNTIVALLIMLAFVFAGIGLLSSATSEPTNRLIDTEVYERVLTESNFSLDVFGAVWLRLYSDQPFIVNDLPAANGEYGGYVYEVTNWSGERGEVVLNVSEANAVSISATGNLSGTLVLPASEDRLGQVALFGLLGSLLALILFLAYAYGQHLRLAPQRRNSQYPHPLRPRYYT